MSKIVQPVLIYSNYCKHSLELIDLLRKNGEVASVILPLVIDPVNGKRPSEFYELQSYLRETYGKTVNNVPTLVLPSGDGELILLTGNDAFSWAENLNKVNLETAQPEQLPLPLPEKEILGVNQNEMLSFSDSYAPLNGNINDASSQSFQFLNAGFQRIQTVNEDAIGKDEKNCQDKYERLLKEREMI
jgi:hypothetical protein